MGVTARKEKERDIRKKDIIDAAEKIFFEKGFHNATMDDIAKEAEFSKRTVYVYFRSKEQLYFEIMIRGYKLLNGLFEKVVEENCTKTGIEKTELLGKALVDFSNLYPEYFKAIMDYENGDMDFENNDDKSIKECYMEGEKLFDFLKDTLDEGIQDGTVLNGIDVINTALILWASMVGVLNTSKKKEKYLIHYRNRTIEELVEEALKFLICSIKK
ncbi:TetR family transcriptional regulator [Mobilisporobacter senegalensis]|uniref:TetR family transcriptional regulator n=1 Tax=Mobilisporobacter senegalensis TaxID=1329262 RepID=A0A3N1XAV6_9FIRM|nr:TetR/AcrR family transcriptional regulator [Mobilisporobacter senegalensis]ROR23909.1 TetR family transcriptional regulator [Mobilisporobacter senegalensis]